LTVDRKKVTGVMKMNSQSSPQLSQLTTDE